MNPELEQQSSFSSSNPINSMGAGVPLAVPPKVLIPGKHLPEPTSLIDMQVSQSPPPHSPSPMDVVSVLTTPVETMATTTPKPEGDHHHIKQEEKVGRWSDAEHKIFLEGLERYGKQWKTIALMIGTRTVVQVRTHAQKYFQKLERKSKTSSSSSADNSSNKLASSSSSSSAPTLSPVPRGGAKTTTTTMTTAAASKRKSLTGALSVASSSPAPSRKKPRSPKKTTTTTRVVSLTSACTASPPPPPLELPHYMSNASSLENLSTISPTGVADMDLGLVSSYSTINTAAPDAYLLNKDNSSNNMYMEVNVDPTSVATGAGGAPSAVGLDVHVDLGDDPLEWLIDGGINHLPESSLEQAPMFPDFSDMTTMGGAAAAAAENNNVTTTALQVQPKSFDTSFLQEIADPKVTVQSLFLESSSSPNAQA